MVPEVIPVDNAVTALMTIGRSPPDLLVMDLQMPGMDGFRMLREMHASPEISNTNIVVVTGLDAAAIAERGGLPAGVEVLPKPIPFNRLLEIATGLVSQRRF
jgi:CheY-like chemotaxis protein